MSLLPRAPEGNWRHVGNLPDVTLLVMRGHEVVLEGHVLSEEATAALGPRSPHGAPGGHTSPGPRAAVLPGAGRPGR